MNRIRQKTTREREGGGEGKRGKNTPWNTFGSNFTYNNHFQLPEEIFF
jgi:hypothetical protein